MNDQIDRHFKPISSAHDSYLITGSHELLPVLSSVSSKHVKRPAYKTGTTKTLNLDNTKSLVQYSSAEVGFHSIDINMESCNSCIITPLNLNFSQLKTVQHMNSMTFIKKSKRPYDLDVLSSKPENEYNSSDPPIDNQRQILPVPKSLSCNSHIMPLATPSFKDCSCDYSLTLPSSLSFRLLLTPNLSNQKSRASEMLPSIDGKINASEENMSQISSIASTHSSVSSSTEVIPGPQTGSFISSPTLHQNDIISSCVSNQTHAYKIPTFHDCIPNTQLETLSRQATGHFHANELSVLSKETIEAFSEQQNVFGFEKHSHSESGNYTPVWHIIKNA